jgi:hypothetical protein
MATVKFEGRDIPMDDTIAGSDELLKQALIPHLGPEIANATISREQKEEGQPLVVTLVKRAGPKGAFVGFAGLLQAPERINPVFGVAWMLRWNDARGTLDLLELLELQALVDATLAQGADEERHAQRALQRLKQAPALALPAQVVVGF